MTAKISAQFGLASNIDGLRVDGLNGFLGEGFCESRRCSRDTYPESYITEYTLVYKDKTSVL
jgi:hypothetical protein